jgi:hypothetical protein
VLSIKEHGDVLREKFPKRRLPRIGYVPYVLVLGMAPGLGFRRDFVRYVEDACVDCRLRDQSAIQA